MNGIPRSLRETANFVNAGRKFLVYFCKSNSGLVLVTLMILCGIDCRAVGAQTPVAIHATQEEINIWKQRQKHGPYLDDWNRISLGAGEFFNNPSSALWPGNQMNEQWERSGVREGRQRPNFRPGRGQVDGLRDAAFVFLVTANEKYRDVVLQTLLKQATIPGTDFADKTKWNASRTGHDLNVIDLAP